MHRGASCTRPHLLRFVLPLLLLQLETGLPLGEPTVSWPCGMRSRRQRRSALELPLPSCPFTHRLPPSLTLPLLLLALLPPLLLSTLLRALTAGPAPPVHLRALLLAASGPTEMHPSRTPSAPSCPAAAGDPGAGRALLACAPAVLD